MSQPACTPLVSPVTTLDSRLPTPTTNTPGVQRPDRGSKVQRGAHPGVDESDGFRGRDARAGDARPAHHELLRELLHPRNRPAGAAELHPGQRVCGGVRVRRAAANGVGCLGAGESGVPGSLCGVFAAFDEQLVMA